MQPDKQGTSSESGWLCALVAFCAGWIGALSTLTNRREELFDIKCETTPDTRELKEWRQNVLSELRVIKQNGSSRKDLGIAICGVAISIIAAICTWYYSSSQLNEMRLQQLQESYVSLTALNAELQLNRIYMKSIIEDTDAYSRNGKFLASFFQTSAFDQGCLTKFTDDTVTIGKTMSIYASLKEANSYISIAHGLQMSGSLNNRQLHNSITQCNLPVIRFCQKELPLCSEIIELLDRREQQVLIAMDDFR